MPFSRDDVREDFRAVTASQIVGSSLSEDSIRSNVRERLAVARAEIWRVGDGALNRGLDCNACRYASICSSDDCRRMS